ncbi:hypothetical protein GGC47_001070 [Bosea sp. OAE752]|uniref:hypothetical protein n=1 Tax=Bosea sp. OAE752 TaxID=2663873 RepID=UPI003D1AD9D4
MDVHQNGGGQAAQSFVGPGNYRFRAPANPAVAWCELDEAGDVAIFGTEVEARSGSKPLIRVSQDWFGDIALERISDRSKHPPRWQRILARLDARGAIYAAVEGRPGWFVAAWFEPGYPQPDGGPWEQYFRPGQRIYGSKAILKAVARRAAGQAVPA